MYQRIDVKEGMLVRSIDGEKLGKVFAVQDDEFLIEKGLFFPKDYVCRYAEISDIRDGEIILMHGKEGLHRFSFDEDRGVLAGTGGTAGVGPGAVSIPKDRPAMHASFQEETGVPLRAEEADVEMRVVVDEEVIIRRDTIEEEPRVAEPVRREEGGIRGDGDGESSRKLDLTPDDPTLRRS
ncbi:DUF2382 domain-containing protein [Hyalangium minutum]|uniref:DUF2382 domain-containing protein n=1 Tax=Hyalangium minutum TaxID=394096 RepID=A0A085VZ71_9BACT|nr:DUF2382 domain-containing protein [Hyalangium minutum]KFE60734.1 hypothetical protein DB31_4647 [Hyalangium minutum]